MCVCVCACMRIYMRVYVHVYVCMCLCLCAHVCESQNARIEFHVKISGLNVIFIIKCCP